MTSKDIRIPGNPTGRMTVNREPQRSIGIDDSLVLVSADRTTNGVRGAQPASAIDFIGDRVEELIAGRPVGVLHRLRGSMALYPWGEGFPIYVSSLWGGDDLVLGFGGWHEDGLDLATIERLIQNAIAGRIRIKNVRLNGKPWKFSAEMLGAGNEWRSLGEISYFRMALFRRDVSIELNKYPCPTECKVGEN